MIRIKVKCRNLGKITRKSIMEMDDDIYLLNFKARDVEQEADNEEGVMEKMEKRMGRRMTY